MSRTREAGTETARNSPPPAWPAPPPVPGRAALVWAAAGTAVGAAVTLAVAAYLARQTVGGPWLYVPALVLMCAGAWVGGAGWGHQRLASALRTARMDHQLLGQLLDAWCWQTDADHRLVRLQPPQGAPVSAWAGMGATVQMAGKTAGKTAAKTASQTATQAMGQAAGLAPGPLLWQRFCDAEQTLPARLQAQAPLGDLQVQRAWPAAQPGGGAAPAAPEATPENWRLRAQPRWDAQGRFCGFLGLAWPTEPLPSNPDPNPNTNPAAEAEHAAFSYTVSHDLRAPIRVIEGFGRILKEDYGAALDRVGRDHLDRVMAAAARMNHMIDALLSLSRLSAQPLAQQPVNLSQLARWVIDDLQRATPERQVEVVIAPDMVTLGDPTLLRMALENLLGNAWKYSAKVAQPQIRFEQVQAGGRLAYRVQDNGAGFDMRFADRLFGVFQRLHSSSDFPGHGVGLASVQRIVRRHGGNIWAEGEVGQGAQFCFTLRP